MTLRKACEHGLFDPHRFPDGASAMFGWPSQSVCEGGTEPTTEELIQALTDQGWIVPPLQPRYTTSYDIEIPDFVNRIGIW